jgi:hypothetical protein
MEGAIALLAIVLLLSSVSVPHNAILASPSMPPTHRGALFFCCFFDLLCIVWFTTHCVATPTTLPPLTNQPSTADHRDI